MNRGWPEQLPKATDYFALLREDTAAVPPEDIIPAMVTCYLSLKKQALGAGQRLSGFQLDFDCPTERLGEYAHFLKELRRTLPPEDRLSITALLDWFRPVTKIADVLQWVDEYIPQFYDLGNPGVADGYTEIATAIDPSTWAPIFNSHSRPYRIGIATFGRISESCDSRDSTASVKSVRRKFIREYDSFEMARQEGLELIGETRGQSGERIVRFNAAAERPAGYSPCADSREIIEMIIPTRESVLAAYDSAKQFGGLCRGVVFYRWPSENEAMVLSPDEVSEYISGTRFLGVRTTIETDDGFCAAVSCVDLYLRRSGDRFSPVPLSLRIHSSKELEYFLPREGLDGKLIDRRTLEIRLPAYLGDPRIYLGRALSHEPAVYNPEGKR
jgi:hypothetical protein